MKRIAIIFLLTFLTFSCNKDDEYSKDDYTKSIIGEWELISESGWMKINGVISIEYTDRVDNEYYRVYTYKEDGTLIEEVYSRLEPSISRPEKYKWSIVGDVIAVKYADGEFKEAIEKILSINSTEMKTLVNFSERIHETVYEYYEVITYKRR